MSGGEGIYGSEALPHISTSLPYLGFFKLVFHEDQILLEPAENEVGFNGLQVLLEGIGASLERSELKPCFNIEEMRQRNVAVGLNAKETKRCS